MPLLIDDSYIRHLFIMACHYAVIASNWDLTLGSAGIFNFGHMTFFGAGVYTAAIAAKSLGLSPWLAIPLGGVVAALIAAMLAAPVVRLMGIYVVLATFAFSQLALQIILSQSQITGGAQGITRIPYLALSMVLIGGVGATLGPILAALALTFATEVMAGIRGIEEARFIVVEASMILVLRFAPSRLVGLHSRLKGKITTGR